MVSGDILYSSDHCRVNPVKNNVVLEGGYTWVCKHSRESVCDVLACSGSVLDVIVKAHERVLPSPELLAVWCLLNEGEQRFMITQDCKLVYSQLGF